MIEDSTSISESTYPAVTDPTAYKFRPQDILLGAQMLFVAFGALVLVPILTGLNPNVALFTAGLGTLVFQLVTGARCRCFWLLLSPSSPRFSSVLSNMAWAKPCLG